jgi:hypothetical protein
MLSRPQACREHAGDKGILAILYQRIPRCVSHGLGIIGGDFRVLVAVEARVQNHRLTEARQGGIVLTAIDRRRIALGSRQGRPRQERADEQQLVSARMSRRHVLPALV